jgi:hypothetical protein
MFEKLSTSWQLTKQSWAVLREHKPLMLFPLISGVLTAVIVCTFMLPVLAYFAIVFGWHKAGGTAGAESSLENLELWQRVVLWSLTFVCYFLTNLVVTFFNSALVACAMNHFKGVDASPSTGLGIAMSRWKQIIAWSFVNATVGVVLQALKERVGWLAQLVLGFAGVVWTVATYFVVPVLVVEGTGPIDATRRSIEILRKTWGESLIVQVGVGTVLGLVGLVLFGVCALSGVGIAIAMDSPVPAAIGVGIGLVLCIGIALVTSVLKTILVAACYQLASTGTVPEQFDAQTLRAVLGPKKSGK